MQSPLSAQSMAATKTSAGSLSCSSAPAIILCISIQERKHTWAQSLAGLKKVTAQNQGVFSSSDEVANNSRRLTSSRRNIHSLCQKYIVLLTKIDPPPVNVVSLHHSKLTSNTFWNCAGPAPDRHVIVRTSHCNNLLGCPYLKESWSSCWSMQCWLGVITLITFY